MDVSAIPELAAGVRLHGEMPATGYRHSQWLVERSGGFLQVPELLYRVAESADGQRTVGQIAARVSGEGPWLISPEQVAHVLDAKLRPAGVIAVDGDFSAVSHAPRPRSPLQITARARMVGPRGIDRLARVLQVMYRPPLVVVALTLAALAHVWLYAEHGVRRPIADALLTPGLLVPLAAVVILAAAFHELGHASALRYGGGRARAIGAGFYLVYPVFYTDVTDGYRLGRAARVRTDLGGVYFHLLFALGVVIAYLASGQEFLLAAVLLIDVEVARQFFPFVRLDGYWLLSDVTGIPDLFSQAVPFVRSLLPGRGRRGALPPLKRWAKLVFATYLAVTIPALTALAVITAERAPGLLATARDALASQGHALRAAFDAGDPLTALAAIAQMLLIALPVLALALLTYALLRLLSRPLARRLRPRPA